MADALPASLRKLVQEGKLVLPRRELRDVLAEMRRPRGPASDAGTRARQEQRGDRV